MKSRDRDRLDFLEACMYCRASAETSDAAVGVCPDCCGYSLHRHLAWPLQFCFQHQCGNHCVHGSANNIILVICHKPLEILISRSIPATSYMKFYLQNKTNACTQSWNSFIHTKSGHNKLVSSAMIAVVELLLLLLLTFCAPTLPTCTDSNHAHTLTLDQSTSIQTENCPEMVSLATLRCDDCLCNIRKKAAHLVQTRMSYIWTTNTAMSVLFIWMVYVACTLIWYTLNHSIDLHVLRTDHCGW